MRKQDVGFDYHRYHRLLLEADDDNKRLALIELLIEEKARDRLAAQRASDRPAMRAPTIANVQKSARNGDLRARPPLARIREPIAILLRTPRKLASNFL